ncbi:hypothetical protein HGRIS_010280 [Hohenbuehelia grisea]|uniref:F-box domain-containing protein n=1 Tax=Hohenbuehelia grisea TaxID=104357 RepID=A0ABR3J3U9_9AGAR
MTTTGAEYLPLQSGIPTGGDSETLRPGCPQEILDIIIGNLHDEQRTLLSLSLTSHACMVSSRRHSLKTIILFTPTAHTFLELLRSPSSTLLHCRETSLHLYGTDKIFKSLEKNPHCVFDYDPDELWINKATTLPPNVFSFVQSLTVDFSYYPQRAARIMMTKLPALFSQIKSLTILWKDVTLVEVAKLSSAFPFLDTLAVGWGDYITHVTHDETRKKLHRPPPQLRNMILKPETRLEEKIFPWLLSAKPPILLASLEISAYDASVNEYFRLAGGSIKDLSIYVGDLRGIELDRYANHLDWKHLTALQSITFSYKRLGEGPDEELNRIISALGSLSLRSLHICTGSKVQDLDCIDHLFNLPKFRLLEAFKVSATNFYEGWEEQAFPVCHQRGILLSSV